MANFTDTHVQKWRESNELSLDKYTSNKLYMLVYLYYGDRSTQQAD